MGLLRKTMSVSTAGLVPYRNKEERATKYAKQTLNAARALVAQQAVDLQLQRDQAEGVRQLNAQAEARRIEAAQQSRQGHATPSGPPPGWYQDPDGELTRWWDGTAWTEHRK